MPAHPARGPAPDVEPLFYTIQDLVTRTQLSRSNILDMVRRGDFPAPVRFGVRANRWRRATVDEWLNSLEPSATPLEPRGVMAERARKKAEQAQS